MIYLASPYTHNSVHIRQQRFLAARRYTAQAMAKGELIFSPIVYGHQFAVDHNHPVEFYYWQGLSEQILLSCTECRVLMLDGWQESKGVQHELDFAQRHGLDITYAEAG